jgi:hypothetical protein
MAQTIHWPGKSGKRYCYWFLEDLTAEGIQAVAGNYAFAKQVANNNFVPLYFGESHNLQDRIPGHEVWEEALRLGATHVMAHTTPAGEDARCDEERDLIQRWNPPMNVQHRTAG